MAGDWIKIRHDLFDDPAVIQISERLEIDEDLVVGKLLKFWVWVDRHLEKCNAPGVTKKFVDRITGVTGFAEAMQIAGWLAISDDESESIAIPNFDRHLSNSAKKRALTKNRVEKCRNASSVTDALPEKRREEKRCKKNATHSRKRGATGEKSPSERPPDYEAIRLRWNETIAPRLRASEIDLVTDSRRKKLRARLKERPDLWDQIEERAATVSRFVRDKNWLTFDWLIRSEDNATRFCEGQFEDEDNTFSIQEVEAMFGRKEA